MQTKHHANQPGNSWNLMTYNLTITVVHTRGAALGMAHHNFLSRGRKFMNRMNRKVCKPHAAKHNSTPQRHS